jgi:hypothetical protein
MSEAEILKRLAGRYRIKVPSTAAGGANVPCVGCEQPVRAYIAAFCDGVCGDCKLRIAKALDQASNSTEQ